MGALGTISQPIAVLWYLLVIASAQLPCKEALGYHHSNRSFEFSMVGTRNQTGHWITQFQLTKTSLRLENNWKVDLKHSVAEYGGVYSFQIKGVLAVPPHKPEDYELFPGIGYYKFHHATKTTFTEASAICSREGGHLAIINSEEEANALKILYTRQQQLGSPSSFVGFYDKTKKREFVTIYGMSLSETGYSKWGPNEPNPANPNAFCGVMYPNSLLGITSCEEKLSFFCEYDYSWGDI